MVVKKFNNVRVLRWNVKLVKSTKTWLIEQSSKSSYANIGKKERQRIYQMKTKQSEV